MSTNFIDGFLHSRTCQFVVDRRQQCACDPIDVSTAMRKEDVLRIFKPLPLWEADALREFMAQPDREVGREHPSWAAVREAIKGVLVDSNEDYPEGWSGGWLVPSDDVSADEMLDQMATAAIEAIRTAN